MEKNRSAWNINPLLVSIFCVVFLIKFLNSFYLYGHSDPLNYHLAMTKLLMEISSADAYKNNIQFLVSGFFDYLYIIPNLIFKNRFFSQLMGQNMHFLFSLGLGSLFLLKKIPNRAIAFLGAIMILTMARSANFYLYAKNDGVLASMGLICAVYIIDSKKIHPIIAGLLLGILPAIKMTGLFLVLPLLVIFFYKSKRRYYDSAICLSTLFLVWSPILVRNYYFMKNPLFPGLIKLFPGNMHSAAKGFYGASINSTFKLQILWEQFHACFFPKVIFFLTPVFMYLNFKKDRKINLYLFVITVFFLLYIAINGGIIAPRFYFPCHFILAFFAAKTLLSHFNKLKRWHLPILLLLTLSDSKIDKSISYIKKEYSNYTTADNTREIVNKMIPHTTFWNKIESSGETKTYIISDLLTQFYHAPKGIFVEHPMHSPKANFFYSCTEKDLRKLDRYSYALLYHQHENPCYDKIRKHGLKLHSQREITLYRIR